MHLAVSSLQSAHSVRESPNQLPMHKVIAQQFNSAVEVTTKQRTDWDRTTSAYAEVWIARGNGEPVSRRIVDAVRAHCQTYQGVQFCGLLRHPAEHLSLPPTSLQMVLTQMAP